MSGAEVLAGIGILCNTMQIVTFGRDALQVFRHVHEGGAPDPKLDTYLDKAATSYKDMNQRVGGLSTIGPLNHDQQRIVDVGEQAHRDLQEFRRKFNKLHVDGNSRSGFRGTFRIARNGIKTIWRAKDLEDVEKNFQRHEQLLQTHMIHRVCSQADATNLMLEESFKHLDASLQHLITKLADGQTELSVLILEHTMDTKKHIVDQHAATRSAMEERLSATAQNLQSHFSESASKLQQDLAHQAKDEECQKRHDQLLASIRYPGMNGRKNQISENYPKTFHWIFDGNLRSSVNPNPVPSWIESNSKLFWISGKPAAGKSTLMKFIASNPLTMENLTAWRSDVQILAHYFWKPGTEMQQNIKGMLLSLLHQVLLDRNDLAAQLWEEQPTIRHKWSHSDWALQELTSALCSALQAANHSFCIFLDGLDEAADFEALLWPTSKNVTILDTLKELEGVKICASSREEVTFCSYFEGVPRLIIHELSKLDIRLFAKRRLGGLSLASEEDRGRLLDTVVRKAEGVFLWVALVLDSITRGLRIGQDIDLLLERIEHTPTDLKRLFQDMWERSGDDGELPSYRAAASRYFNLAIAAKSQDLRPEAYSLPVIAMAYEEQTLKSMLCAGRHITATELYDKCLKAERQIPVICRGLLEVKNRSPSLFATGDEVLISYSKKNIQFVHRCAMDFFADTLLGANLLSACMWSKDEPTARLLGAILVGGRFIRWPLMERLVESTKKSEYFYHGYRYSRLDIVLHDTLEGSIALGSQCRHFLLRISKEWQHAGLLQNRIYWSYPGYPRYATGSLELEFLESAAGVEDLSYPIGLLLEKPIRPFLDAVSVVIRGFSDSYYCTHSKSNHLIGQILSRLLRFDQEIQVPSMVGIMEAKRHVACLMYSWYVNSLLEWIDDLNEDHEINEDHERNEKENVEAVVICAETVELLHLFTIALPNAHDWDLPMPLYFEKAKEGIWKYSGFCDERGPFNQEWSAFVVVNLATAYCIISDMFQGLITEPAVLSGVQPLFQPILIRDENGIFYSPKPDQMDEIGAMLRQSIPLGSGVPRPEHSPTVTRGMPAIAKDRTGALRCLINKLGHLDGFPLHPWTPGWKVLDRSQKKQSG